MFLSFSRLMISPNQGPRSLRSLGRFTAVTGCQGRQRAEALGSRGDARHGFLRIRQYSNMGVNTSLIGSQARPSLGRYSRSCAAIPINRADGSSRRVRGHALSAESEEFPQRGCGIGNMAKVCQQWKGKSRSTCPCRQESGATYFFPRGVGQTAATPECCFR